MRRLHAGVPELSSAMAIGATGSADLAFDAGRDLGGCLRSVGFDVDFAPVLDVYAAGSAIGTRAFSDRPELVATLGSSVARGLAAAHIAAVGKHFPGIGASATDSHDATPVVRHAQLEPFRRAAAAGLPMIIMAHAMAPERDPVHPVSLSPAWHHYLRDDLLFDGVIISDALQMDGLPKESGIGGAAERMKQWFKANF